MALLGKVDEVAKYLTVYWELKLPRIKETPIIYMIIETFHDEIVHKPMFKFSHEEG